jgi:hypothetical protein
VSPGTIPPGSGDSRASAAKKNKAAKKKGRPGRRSKKARKPKKKKKHKCGDSGSYGHMTDNYSADGKERDHVPSSAALMQNAKGIFKGQTLCAAQLNAVKRAAEACVIPKGVHETYSKTFRNRNKAKDSKGRKLYERDAKNKKKAAKRDTKAIKKGLK